MKERRNITSRQLVLVAFFVALTAIGARIEIPLPYVPFTMQTFVVLLAGMLLGSRLGAISQGAYILIGLLGVPVFARGGGIGYIAQPTFGYVLGFIPAAFVVGRLIEGAPQQGRFSFFLVSLYGLGIVYLVGLLYLWGCTHFLLGKSFGLLKTLKVGFLILLPGALCKAACAAVVGWEMSRRLGGIQPWKR